MSKIAVIIGSSRPARIGGQITDWVVENLPKSDDVMYEIIDLAEWNLPFFDEDKSPQSARPVKEHSKKWGAFIDGFQGLVVVTPEYNAGYPAVLKNALDYLKPELKDKPSLVVSYGWDGGLGANKQLQEVLARIGTMATETNPSLAFDPSMWDESGKIIDVDATYGAHAPQIHKGGEELIALLPELVVETA